MIPLSSIVARFEADYLRQHHAAILPGQRQALAAMKHCLSHRLRATPARALRRVRRAAPPSCG